MPTYRSKTTTACRNRAGARYPWRPIGMKDLGQLVAHEIEAYAKRVMSANKRSVRDLSLLG